MEITRLLTALAAQADLLWDDGENGEAVGLWRTIDTIRELDGLPLRDHANPYPSVVQALSRPSSQDPEAGGTE